MANYFDQFEEIKEDNKQKSYWDQFEPMEPEAEVDEFDMDFQDPNKATLGDRLNTVKDNLSKAIATTGQATMSNRPYVPNTSGALEGGVNYINDLASQVGNSINNAGQSVKNAYNTIANKPINLMPSRLMQPVSNAFSGVGRVASDVLPFAMGGYYNSPKDIVEATQEAYKYGVEEAKRDRQVQEMNPINLAESLVDMYTIGKFMPGNKATMLGRMGVAGKTGAVYGGLESLKHKGINPKENIKDAAVDAALFATLEPLAEIGFAAAKEGAKRLNPANYQRIIESVPKTSGSGLSQRTVYEPKVKYEYKPNVKNEYGMKDALNKPRIEANKMSDSTAFELGEASDLKYGVSRPIKEAPKKTVVDYLAPNIAAKQQAKALEKAEKTEEARNSVVENLAPNTANKEVIDVDAKIAELERKMKIVGGEKTLLGQKYKRQIEELRGTQQDVAPVIEETVDTSQLDIKNKQLIYKFIDEGENIGENYGVVRAIGNNNEIVGEINYIYNPKTNTVQISDQAVIPSYQRQGIATDIINIIKNKTGTNKINSNVLTPDGEKFLASIEKKGIIERHSIANAQATKHPEVRSMDLIEQPAPKAEPTEEIQVAETDKDREVILNNLEKAKNTLEMVKKQGGDTTVAENVVKRAQNNLDEYDKLSETTKPATQEVAKRPAKKTPKNTEKSTKTIEDSGEFLQGNRKEDKNGLTWSDLEGMNDLVRAKHLTKAKIYPKPSIDSLKEQGLDTFQAALVQHVYNKIANKIPAGYDTRVETQKEYTENIKNVMDNVIKYFKENPNKYSVAMTEGLRKDIFDVIYPDKDNLVGKYDSIFRKYPEYNRHALIMGGRRFVEGIQISTKELKEIRKIIEDYKEVKTPTSKVKKEDWEKTFTILEPSKYDNKFRIAANKGNQILKGEYNTKDEAIEVARRITEAQKELKNKLKKNNFERDYVQRRENNKDISSDELRETFGFKGVNFGNYVTQKERQDFLNYTYDSLYDLAELLNLPPKALSLNGQLGIAFGAQGRGGRVAGHYIPDFHEINMTKDSGAGTLAHEWWHAFDNYFGSKAEGREFTSRYGLELSKQGEIREDVYKAFSEIDKQMRTAPFKPEEIQERKDAIVARCERNIKHYADTVKNTFKNVEGVAEFVDNLVKNKDKYIKMSDEDMHNLVWKDFGKLIPERRQTIENMARLTWLTGEIQRIGRAEEIAMKTPSKSQYLKDAERLNVIEGGIGKGYWSKHTEMGARAFTTYLLDKMETQQIVNRFLARSQGGEVSMDWDKFASSMEAGDKDVSVLVHWNPTNTEEKARIFSAFDKLFNTIKARETEKGVELYSIDIPEFMKNSKVIDNGLKDIELSPIFESVKKGISGAELAKILPKELGDIVMQRASKYKFTEMITKGKELGVNRWKRSVIELNLKAIGNSPKKFVNTLMHEVKHAEQYKLYLDIMGKPKNSWTFEERSFIAKYNICKSVNKKRSNFYNRHRDLCDRFEKNNFYSAKERDAAILKLSPKEQNIIYTNDRNVLEYLKADFEAEARAEGIKYDKDYKTVSGFDSGRKIGTLSSNNGTKGKWTLGTNSRSGFASVSDTGYRQKAKQSVEQTVRDKVYDWHGGIGKDRYDVDKTLNSFIRMSKNIAKDLSQKTGLKVSDKQLREMLPFLRERTNIPEKLDRDDLKKIFNALSGEEKARLVKFADDTSNKFEKYYKNYLEAKGEVDEASIENHISHIWDLDDKKQALLTNYITTKSRFAKQRTIETLAKGINGIEIDGKIVEFKPKTLDYAEILKSSSDNLIKATYDMQLAETIKGMKDAEGNSLVLPAHKAPADWIEVSHPALNKAVYMGTVGEDELPMLMKSSVKIHPDLEKYVASIFETPKTSSKFWKGYDSINGILKQTQLGFSGFHGYALSESALANMGVKKTLDSLNVKKVYDAVKNGNYEIYEYEAEAKRAIDAGVQLGTPSDLNRNLVEETLNKIPVLGKYISGAVSVNNKILWDVLHNNFKLFTFNAKIAELEKAGKVTKEQERAVAQWVNDTYGGQSWELLGIKNSDVRKAGRVLLSPDWNFSTVRQALGSINNTKLDKVFNDTKAWKRVAELMGVSENIGGEGVRGKIARDFWIRAVVYSTIFYNAMNAAFRADDREKHPERYPKNMKPFDYSIWANANPMDNWYEKMMPYVFIGRNSDGTARMLRVGKQFREVPELAADPITKLSGKSASIIGLLTQVAVGMSPADIVKKVSGREAYLNQNIWEGYGEDARMRDGIEAVTGRLKVAAKGAAPFMLSKYIDGKHEPSAWDMFAQTSVGSTKGKVYKEAKEAFEAGREDKIREIKQKAYRDGVRKEDINKMVGYAEKNYKADNTKKYRKKFVEAMKNKDKKELNRIKSDMQRHHLSAKEQRRIYESAYKKYLQER